MLSPLKISATHYSLWPNYIDALRPKAQDASILSRLKIAARIDLILILAALGMLTCAGIALFASRAQMLEDRRVQLRYLLDLALSIARADMTNAGGPKTEAGRKAFFNALRSAEFGEAAEANYLFAYDYDGVTRVLNRPDLIGKNRLAWSDPNGVHKIQEFIKIAKSPAGTGFLEYLYEKGVGGAWTPKISLVQNVPEIGWVVGVGVYLDDLHAFFRTRLLVEAGWFALALAAITLLSYRISRSITRPLSNLTKKIKSLAKGDTNFALAGADDKSELGDLAIAVEILRVNAIEQQALHATVSAQTLLLIEQKERAERAVKAKSEFLSNMSHELRTPMHAMLSYAKLGFTRIDGTDIKTLETYFNNIHKAGSRLLGLLNNLLDLAKLEAGKMVIKKVNSNFFDVVDHANMEISPLIKDKGLRITTEKAAKNSQALFDKHLIVQVMINLISNAVKFSPPGGSINVTLSDAVLPDGRSALCCSVSDEGAGIPEAELEAVFDKFMQSSKTKTGAGGTGLGLSICREIIAAHGGKIWAENRKPGGTILSFIIPCNGE